MKYWNPAVETMNREELAKMQLTRLKRTVENVYTYVPYYREKMQKEGILPGDIKELSDLQKLPFTTKDDLRENYPFGLFAVPMEQIVRIHASSGTTGKQTVVGYTAKDIEIWSECMARCLVMAHQDNHSKIQVSYGYGLFTGGLGVHYGIERLGATAIPTSTGNTQRQITVMKDFGTTAICCTPSYAIYLAESIEEMGIDKKDLALHAGIFGAEPWTEPMRREIEERLNIKAFDIYGLSEIMGPSVSQDCEYKMGLHIWEDCYLAEIIDPDTLGVLPQDTDGELVFTTIHKEGIPLIRYRTKDISSLHYGVCECGRTHVRMSKPHGRSDDMLIIRGVNVFPSQVEAALLSIGEASPQYQIILERDGSLDIMTVELEISPNTFIDHVKGMEELKQKIRRQIESVLGISCNVRLVEPKTIARSEGKAKRVIDKRGI